MKANEEYNKKLIEIISAHPKSWVVPLKRKDNCHLLAYVYENTKEYPDLTLPERVYWTLNDLNQPPKCANPNCTNRVHGVCYPLEGYVAKYCCNKCACTDQIAKEARAQHNLEEYGYKYPQQAPEKRKYMSDLMRNKSKEEKKRAQKKRIKTCLEKYGVEYVSQTQENRDKVSENWKNKSKEEKQAITRKRQGTLKDKYGDEKYINVEQIKKTRAGFSKEKKAEIQKKRRTTCMDKYGVDCVTKDPTINKKIQHKRRVKSCTRIYNDLILKDQFVDPMFSLEHFIEHSRDTLRWKCKLCGREFEQAIGEHQTKDHKIARCLECFPLYENIIFAEGDIIDYIKSFYPGEVIQRGRRVIAPKELDIWIPGAKVGIEYNGVYWHSLNMGTDPDYHIMKTQMCEEKGIHLLHIFENEWNDNKDFVKSLIRHAIEQKSSSGNLQISCTKKSEKELIIDFGEGTAVLKSLKYDKHFEWHLRDVVLKEESPCSFEDAVEQISKFCFGNLGISKIFMRLDRRFHQLKQSIRNFSLDEVVKPIQYYYTIKTYGTKFRTKSQYSQVLKEAEGDTKRIFSMVDSGQLIYVATRSGVTTV